MKFAYFILSILIFSSITTAQDHVDNVSGPFETPQEVTEECLMCHDDPGFKAKIGGRNISLHVNQKSFTTSVHSDLDCIDCHEGFDADDVPHRKEITKVDCGTCHDDVQELYVECLHGKAKAKGDPLGDVGDARVLANVVVERDPCATRRRSDGGRGGDTERPPPRSPSHSSLRSTPDGSPTATSCCSSASAPA